MHAASAKPTASLPMEVDLEATETFVLAMGNNSDGQLGCGMADEDDDKAGAG